MADLIARPGSTGRSITGDLFGFDPFRALFSNAPNGYNYGAEIRKSENGWTVEIPVPGFKPDEIDVTVEDRVLTVNGKSERRSFQRSILLPEEINVDSIEAKAEHGLLALTLPLHPKAQPRHIEVKVVN